MNEGLLAAVQMARIFPDGKTFVDCIPKKPWESIEQEFNQKKTLPGFDLKRFVAESFDNPLSHASDFTPNRNKPVAENIRQLWNFLTRYPDGQTGTLLPLPHAYITPGGRFGELYYWDSYFSMLGLVESGQFDMVENMIRDFAYLIDRYGYIPNGNRDYFLGRSQPPFFSLMIKLLADHRGKAILTTYLPQLEKEYHFWMKGAEQLTPQINSMAHTVLLPGGEVMNRYWDEQDSPRPEAYREDVELSYHSGQDEKKLYRNLRAGAESGWDFSSRWFKEKEFSSIHTTEIVPVDLNCLLWYLEISLAEACKLVGKNDLSKFYQAKAKDRELAIDTYCWKKDEGFYVDYDYVTGKQKKSLTLAAVYPLFFELATARQAKQVASLVEKRFLFPGGVVTTLEETGQQWDAPNGWAPLQWLTIKGLSKYGFNALAKMITERWVKLNEEVFFRTGKLMEKYNVIDTALEAGGGEYPGQDGFGWTNGVYLALKNILSGVPG